MSSNTRQQLEKWLKTITVSGRVLDVGGSQNPVSGRVNVAEAAVFDILDLEVPHELKEKPNLIWDINKMMHPHDKLLQSLAGEYDIIFCLEVMEYVYDPMTAIINMNSMLKSGGALFVSVPFIYPVHNPKEQDYLRYTEFGIRKLLEMAGFKIENMEARVELASMFRTSYEVEKMRPAKDYDSHNAVGWLVSAVKI